MKEKKETLIIISPGFPIDEKDVNCLPSQQIFVKSLNKEFPSLEIVILASHYPYKRAQYQWHGNKVIALNGKNFPKFLSPVLWIRLYNELRKIYRRSSSVNLLSFWCLEGAFVGDLFSKHYKVQHRIWIAGQDARRGNPFVSWMRPKASDLIAMSDFLADEFEKNYRVRPQHIVPNGVDPNSFQQWNRERTIDLLGAGSLIGLKQYTIFIEVVAELVKVNPSLTALICGGGPEEETLKNKIKTLKLEGNISLAGELPHSEVLQKMKQSKIFLHPSSYEGYSAACLEALYAGCHVISFVMSEKSSIAHWHVARSTDEMKLKCKEILEHNSDFSSVLVHDIRDSAKKMLKFFDYPVIT